MGNRTPGPRKGRPREWQPTAKQRHYIMVAMAAGLKQKEIAGALGISEHMLGRRCRTELDTGQATMNGRVAAKLYQKCMKGDTVALLFWTKTRMGWNERHTVEHTGADGGPIQYEHVKAEADAFTQRIAAMGERFAKAMASKADEAPPANDGELTQKSTEPAGAKQC